MLMENGTYGAVVRDVHLYERGEQKRLSAAFRLDVGGTELVHREWLELNDGTLSERTLQRLRKVFPKWDGTIEKLDEGFCCRDVEVEVVVENEPDQQDPGKTWTRSKFMNPPGGNGAASLPEKADRASLVQRYGSRFRALSGGKSAARGAASGAATVTPPPASRPPAGRAAPAAPAEQAGKSSLEECWELHCKERADQPRAKVEEAWFALLDRAAPGKDSGDFTSDDWGNVKAAFDNLPF